MGLIWASPAESLRDAVGSPEFAAGLRFGLVALALGTVVGIAWRRWAKVPAPTAGLLIAAAFWAGADDVLGVPDELGLVLAVLGVAGLVDDLLEVPLIVRLLLPLPGAWLFATRVEVPTPEWAVTTAAAVIVVGGALTADFDRRYREAALGLPFFALAAAGVYLTVPDTEHALVLLAVCLVMVVLGWPARLARLGSAGAFMAVAVLTWVVTVDGVGRDSSVVGSLACLGLLVAEPVVAALVGRRRVFDGLGRGWWLPVGAGACQLVVVVVASRVAGRRPSALDATIVVAVAFVVAVAVLAVLARRSPSRTPTRTGPR